MFDTYSVGVNVLHWLQHRKSASTTLHPISDQGVRDEASRLDLSTMRTDIATVHKDSVGAQMFKQRNPSLEDVSDENAVDRR
jgi:hypothetical protein